MLVLAVDTSSSTGSVAVVIAHASPWRAEIVAESMSLVSNAHGESLLPVIDATLRAARTTLAAIDLIAVGIGPGSFTGTRIGVATAKGLALGSSKPLRGVDAFHALAIDAGAPVGEELAIAIDARKSEVYFATVTMGELDVETSSTPRHLRPEHVAEALAGHAIASVTGDGVHLVESLAPFAGARRRIGVVVPRASAIAALAGARQLRSPIDEGDALEPFYVRPPDITMPKAPPGMPRR